MARETPPTRRAAATAEPRAGAITSREVARLAGVSQATVSRVLHDHPGVRPDVRERVQRVLAQTQYQPNAMARAMKTSVTGSVGVVVARLSNPLYPAMLQVIGSALARCGLRMVVWDSEHGGEWPAQVAMRQGIVDGVLLTTATAESPLLREAADTRAPVVLVNRTVDSAACDQVSSDNVAGGATVARYLIACGRRRIAMIGGTGVASTIRDRERGFRQALDEAGRPLDFAHVEQVDTFSHETGRAAAHRLLDLARPPDALFCTNDVIALGAVDGARARGLRVPEDLWVVGYDDIEMASWGAYDLTTVRQPLDEMVGLAVGHLRARMRGDASPPVRDCLPNGLVIRGSTARTPMPAGPREGKPLTKDRA